MMLAAVSSLSASGKMYIDEKEMCSKKGAFHIHMGHNNWIQTNTVHRDASGLYTFESNIRIDPIQMAYERQWKCPYCYSYWPIGKPCQNPDCPSKYK
jgi:hypothetical protein